MCSRLHKRSVTRETVSEEYEQYLGLMLWNSTNIAQPKIEAFSTLQDQDLDMLANYHFFVEKLPYLFHQYDERDFVLHVATRNYGFVDFNKKRKFFY